MTQRLIFSILLGLLLLPGLVSAQTGGASTATVTPTGTTTADIQSFSKLADSSAKMKDALNKLKDFQGLSKTEKEANRLATLKDYGNKLIDARFETLLKIMEMPTTRCASASASTDTKKLFTDDAVTIQNNLKDEQTRIASAQTSPEVKIIIKEILEKNRVYLNFSPAMTGICSSANLLAVIEKVRTNLATLQDKGFNITEITPLLDDAKINAQQALDIYLAIAKNPSGASKKAQIDQAKTLLLKAKDDLTQVRTKIGDLQSSNSTPTPTVTP